MCIFEYLCKIVNTQCSKTQAQYALVIRTRFGYTKNILSLSLFIDIDIDFPL